METIPLLSLSPDSKLTKPEHINALTPTTPEGFWHQRTYGDAVGPANLCQISQSIYHVRNDHTVIPDMDELKWVQHQL